MESDSNAWGGMINHSIQELSVERIMIQIDMNDAIALDRLNTLTAVILHILKQYPIYQGRLDWAMEVIKVVRY